ncbi:MAG TPA: hypothetical protein VFC68_01415, partial [Treponemataceae bacterium]|nr:hypothetical protein [Treponemataceae bacterium]
DIVMQKKFLEVLAYTGTSDYSSTIATILKKTNDTAIIQQALDTIASIGYDPEGKMIDAIEHILPTNKTKVNETIIILSADAVYEICRFMGRPAFYAKGKDILVRMLSYRNIIVWEYTIQILEKIIKLQM